MEDKDKYKKEKQNTLQKKEPPALKPGQIKSENPIKAKFLYINKDFLFEAAPKETILRTLQKEGTPKDLKEELELALKTFNEITENCNQKVKDLDRKQIIFKGFHVPEKVDLSFDLIESIKSGNINEDDLSKEILDKMVVRKLKDKDYIKPVQGKKLDWLSYMIPDGKVFPYTILTESSLSNFGMPIGLYTKDGEDVDPNSLKYVFYLDPNTNKVLKGIYFEVYESPGVLGKGGINGIISKIEYPLLILNYKRKEAYFVNIEQSKEGLGGFDMLTFKLGNIDG